MSRFQSLFEPLESRRLMSVAADAGGALAPRQWSMATHAGPTAVSAARKRDGVGEDAAVRAALGEVVRSTGVPGIVGRVIGADGKLRVGSAGVRKAGSPAAVTVGDRFHLGSCGKAMTAALAARLVEAGVLRWDSTVAEVFPSLVGKIRPAYETVTLEQLLSHRGGIPGDEQLPADVVSFAAQFRGNPRAGRAAVLYALLNVEPQVQPGRYEYSNAGYALAAAMMETAAGASYEALMQRYVFKPLGIKTAVVGAPKSGGGRSLSAPWGHSADGTPLSPKADPDPKLLAPAGLWSMTLADWARFVSAALGGFGADGRRFLSDVSVAKLQTPQPSQDGEPSYAMGWEVLQTPSGNALTHDGSNDYWYARVVASPGAGTAVLVVTNRGGEAGRSACDAGVEALLPFTAP